MQAIYSDNEVVVGLFEKRLWCSFLLVYIPYRAFVTNEVETREKVSIKAAYLS